MSMADHVVPVARRRFGFTANVAVTLRNLLYNFMPEILYCPLGCRGGRLLNRKGHALVADRAVIKGDVFSMRASGPTGRCCCLVPRSGVS
jgi:hypothetical protein